VIIGRAAPAPSGPARGDRDLAVGELNLEASPRYDGGRRADRAVEGVAHECETARQHALVGVALEQVAERIEPQETAADQVFQQPGPRVRSCASERAPLAGK